MRANIPYIQILISNSRFVFCLFLGGVEKPSNQTITRIMARRLKVLKRVSNYHSLNIHFIKAFKSRTTAYRYLLRIIFCEYKVDSDIRSPAATCLLLVFPYGRHADIFSPDGYYTCRYIPIPTRWVLLPMVIMSKCLLYLIEQKVGNQGHAHCAHRGMTFCELVNQSQFLGMH